MFIHTLDIVPQNWYTKLEQHQGTMTWDEMAENFEITFSYQSEYPSMDVVLQIIKEKTFADLPLLVSHIIEWDIMMEHALECYNIT